MAVDADVLEQIRERLRVSTRVGDDRIEVATRDDDVVLLGAVASPEESTVAGQLAEALDENEPWSPPDVPQLAPTATEQRGGWAPENALALSEWEQGGDPDDLLDEEDRAAREELEEGEG